MERKLAQKSFGLVAATVAAVFMLTESASALTLAPVQDSGGLSATLAQMHERHGGGVHRGGGGYGYHGGHNVVRGGHNTVVVGGRGAWGRGYRWPPGGAIAAGVAVGFLAAGAAVAYTATRPPAPGLCWYYRDPSYTSGFWDVCP